MNKREEKYLFEIFQEKFEDMPLGDVEFEDKPDVIVTLPTGETIGIELTECIYDEQLMGESQYRIKFNEKVIERLESFIPFKFHLDIDLDTVEPLRQNQISTTVQEILEFCIMEFADLQPYEFRTVQQLNVDWSKMTPDIQKHFLEKGYRQLPIGISRIYMIRYDCLLKSRHPGSKGGVVPDFTQDLLNAILEKKDKALVNYKNCTQQWLVIGEGGDFYSYVDDIKIEKGFETRFNKVFMYRRWKSEVFILK